VDSTLDWGIDVILWFQQFSPTFDLLFKGLTFLGNLEFFLLFPPLIYWCVSRRTGVRLSILLLISAHVNFFAKIIADQPRPFTYDSRVKAIVAADGGGFPSGHTQGAVVVWGYLAYCLRNPLMWVVTALLMIGIPLSRVYLGVHFPTDLLGGYILGAVMLAVYIRLAPTVESLLNARGFGWQIGAAIVGPFVLMTILPGGDDGVVTCAALMGQSVGFVLERRWVGFRAGGVWWRRILRYIIGVAIMFALYLGLKSVFDTLEPASLFRFVRYLLVGLWGGFGAPWIFVKLRLVDTE